VNDLKRPARLKPGSGCWQKLSQSAIDFHGDHVCASLKKAKSQ
jgi:hypothetical protein